MRTIKTYSRKALMTMDDDNFIKHVKNFLVKADNYRTLLEEIIRNSNNEELHNLIVDNDEEEKLCYCKWQKEKNK